MWTSSLWKLSRTSKLQQNGNSGQRKICQEFKFWSFVFLHQYHDQDVQQVGELLANASKLRQLFSGENHLTSTYLVVILRIIDFILMNFFFFINCQRHRDPHHPRSPSWSQCWHSAGQTSVSASARVSPWFRLTFTIITIIVSSNRSSLHTHVQ